MMFSFSLRNFSLLIGCSLGNPTSFKERSDCSFFGSGLNSRGGESYELRQKISGIRRTAIAMRRYLAPQRDVMARLYNEKVDWLGENERMRLREVADRTTRYVEDLDSVRDRATVTQEELNNRLTEQMNRTMYVLSIVAGIFLPLGLLTGLLGINIGGIPGTENPWAFTIFCILLLVISAFLVWLFKRMKWM